MRTRSKYDYTLSVWVRKNTGRDAYDWVVFFGGRSMWSPGASNFLTDRRWNHKVESFRTRSEAMKAARSLKKSGIPVIKDEIARAATAVIRNDKLYREWKERTGELQQIL